MPGSKSSKSGDETKETTSGRVTRRSSRTSDELKSTGSGRSSKASSKSGDESRSERLTRRRSSLKSGDELSDRASRSSKSGDSERGAESPKDILRRFAQLNETVPPSQPDDSPTLMNIKKSSRRSSRRSSGLKAEAMTPHALLRNFMANAPEGPTVIDDADDTSEKSSQSETYSAPIPRKVSKMVDDDEPNVSSEAEGTEVVRKMPRTRHKAVLPKLTTGVEQKSSGPSEDSGSEIKALPSKSRKIRSKITAEDFALGIKLSQEKAAERPLDMTETTKGEMSLGYLSVNTLNAENLQASTTTIPESQEKEADSFIEEREENDSSSSKSEGGSKRKRGQQASPELATFNLTDDDEEEEGDEEIIQKSKMSRLDDTIKDVSSDFESTQTKADKTTEAVRSEVSKYVSEAERSEVSKYVSEAELPEVGQNVEVVEIGAVSGEVIRSEEDKEARRSRGRENLAELEMLLDDSIDALKLSMTQDQREEENIASASGTKRTHTPSATVGSVSSEQVYLQDDSQTVSKTSKVAVGTSRTGDYSDVSDGSGSRENFTENADSVAEATAATSLVEAGSGTSLVEATGAMSIVEAESETSLTEATGATSLVEAESGRSLVETTGATSLVEAESRTSLVEATGATSLVEAESGTSLAEATGATSLIKEESGTSLVEATGATSIVEAASGTSMSEAAVHIHKMKAEQKSKNEFPVTTIEAKDEGESRIKKEPGSSAEEHASTDEQDELFPSSPKETTSSDHSRSSSPASSEEVRTAQRLTLPSSKSAFVKMKSSRSKVPSPAVSNVPSASKSALSNKIQSSERRDSKRKKLSQQRIEDSYRFIDTMASPTGSVPSMEVSNLTKSAQVLAKSPFGTMRSLQRSLVASAGRPMAPEPRAGPSQPKAEQSRAGPSQSQRSLATQNTAVNKTKSSHDRQKMTNRLKNHVIPPKVTSRLISHFSGLKIPQSCLPMLGKISDQFFDNLFDTLQSYAHHANRRKIDNTDVELYFKRIGLVTKEKNLNTLIRESLPLEDQQLLIPVARAGNVISGGISKKKPQR